MSASPRAARGPAPGAAAGRWRRPRCPRSRRRSSCRRSSSSSAPWLGPGARRRAVHVLAGPRIHLGDPLHGGVQLARQAVVLVDRPANRGEGRVDSRVRGDDLEVLPGGGDERAAAVGHRLVDGIAEAADAADPVRAGLRHHRYLDPPLVEPRDLPPEAPRRRRPQGGALGGRHVDGIAVEGGRDVRTRGLAASPSRRERVPAPRATRSPIDASPGKRNWCSGARRANTPAPLLAGSLARPRADRPRRALGCLRGRPAGERRVPGPGHRDQWPRRRPLRVDGGGHGLVGGGELHEAWASLVGSSDRCRAASSASPDHPGDGRHRAAAGRGPARGGDRLDGGCSWRTTPRFDSRSCATPSSAPGSTGPGRPCSARWPWRARFAPLATRRELAALAGSLGIEVDEVHRALPDALTCARVFCALFPKLCANAAPSATRSSSAGRGGAGRTPAAAWPRRTARTSRSCRTTRASTSSATSAGGRSTWASRCRSVRAREPTSARRRAGPSGRRSWTTCRPTRSWARSCSRTG